MNPEQIYQQLKELAEKLDIQVSEQNFKKTGIPVKSGFCKVKDRQRFIIDKNLSVSQKNQLLASFLNRFQLDNMFILPKIRDYIERQK